MQLRFGVAGDGLGSRDTGLRSCGLEHTEDGKPGSLRHRRVRRVLLWRRIKPELVCADRLDVALVRARMGNRVASRGRMAAPVAEAQHECRRRAWGHAIGNVPGPLPQ